MDETRRNDLADLWGNRAMVITLAYVLIGNPIQIYDILVLGRVPSVWMMLFVSATFASWSRWAALKGERAPLIANMVGLCTSLMIVGLTLWVTTIGPIESGKPATTSDSENTSIESFSRPPAAIIDKTASFPKSSRFDTGVNHE